MLNGKLGLANESLEMYVVGMTIIGVGWNLSFVGPSAEVSKIYKPAEQAKVIGFNDGIMLLTIGILAMAGSSIYEAIGSWSAFNIMLMGVSSFSAVIAGWREVSTRVKARRSENERTSSFFDQHFCDIL